MTPGQCWICGAKADSREHRLKKSDLVRGYGRGPYAGGKQPIHFRGDRRVRVQGPRSKLVVYNQPSLCHHCNTARSQPFDRAYEHFVDWALTNEAARLADMEIDFQQAFGSDAAVKQLDLFRYFAKSFGCRLYDAGQEVPQEIVDLVLGGPVSRHLHLYFAVSQPALLLRPEDRKSFIGKGGVVGYGTRAAPKDFHSFESHEHVGWLCTFYYYGPHPDPEWGSPWDGVQNVAYLGEADIPPGYPNPGEIPGAI